MGPRLGSRGKSIALTLSDRSPPGFNGAATWKSRKGLNGSQTLADLARFNGAATWKSRKVNAANGLCAGRGTLQWGRDLEVAESLRLIRRSMRQGWLQWGRDLEVAESSSIFANER